MTDFVSAAQAHLASYKATALGITEHGLWARNSKPYPHILPAHLRTRNLLPTIQADFELHRQRSPWKLHRDFHHLTSSQALAFNLFLPVVAGWPGVRRPYSDLLGLAPQLIQDMSLEAIPDRKEGTNFDALATMDEPARAYIEVKFTETGFGTAKADETHCRRLTTIYRPRLEGRVDDACLEESHFFAHYQLYRNLSALRPGHDDLLVLLLPRAHAVVWNHAKTWTGHDRLRNLRNRIRLIALEDVVAGLCSLEAMDHRFLAHAEGLKSKYLFAAA